MVGYGRPIRCAIPEVEVDYIDDGDGEYGEAGITVEEINRMLAEAAEGGE